LGDLEAMLGGRCDSTAHERVRDDRHRERAKAEGGEIHWGDETALVNTDVRGRSYAPKGETPVTCAPGTRRKLSMMSTVTNKGQARWIIIDGNFDADRLIEFLEALLVRVPRLATGEEIDEAVLWW